MGLNVSAYAGIERLDATLNEDWEPVDTSTGEVIEGNCFFTVVNCYFPSQSDGLPHKGVYSYKDAYGFRAGSYGSYNSWREQLAKLAGYKEVPYERVPGYEASTIMSAQIGAFEAECGPFHELVCFSDCEGTIGPVTSLKLAQDFLEWNERAQTAYPSDPWFYQMYLNFKQAFELAAHDGAVSFH